MCQSCNKSWFVLLLFCSNWLFAQKEVPTKVIYFMAGVKDHAGPSRHETEKDLTGIATLP